MDKNTKILIVDDFPTVRNIIKSVLNHLGYESLLEAEDGNSALPILRRENIGFVVTDWKMPGMEGIDLLKIIRQYSNHTELPVLMVTAESEDAQKREALNAGANAILFKPFTPKQLERSILDVFSQLEAAA